MVMVFADDIAPIKVRRGPGNSEEWFGGKNAVSAWIRDKYFKKLGKEDLDKEVHKAVTFRTQKIISEKKRTFEIELIESKLKLRELWKQLRDLCRKPQARVARNFCLEDDNINLFNPKDVKDFKTCVSCLASNLLIKLSNSETSVELTPFLILWRTKAK